MGFNFDTTLAEALYQKAISGDHEAAASLHEHARPLFEVIAWSVTSGDSTMHEDLVQEAHLKLALIIRDRLYEPDRGSKLYSYLSVVMRNHMLDVVTGKVDTSYDDMEQELVADDGADAQDVVVDAARNRVLQYMLCRFPNIDPYIIADVSCYVIDAMSESVNDRSRGILRTMCVVYLLDRNTAWALYWCTVTVLRMDVMGIDWWSNIPSALEVLEVTGCISSLPEMGLYLGKDVADISKVFKGSYVKF